MRKNYFRQCAAFALPAKSFSAFLKLNALSAFFIFFTHFKSFADPPAVYTYTGFGDWTDTGNWSPSYPGTTIDLGDEVIIDAGSFCTIPIAITVDINGTLTNNGGLNIGLDFTPGGATGTLNINGIFINNNNFTFDGTFNNYGTFENLSNISADVDLSTSGTGLYKGSGLIISSHDPSLFKNTGTLQPEGTMTFQFNYENNGALNIRIGGPTNSDLLKVENVMYPTSSGTATLGGTLNISLKSGYTGTDNITILEATALSGTFATVNLPSNWFINYNKPTNGKVTLSYGALLPVELLSFQAKPISNSVKLSWQTADEINNKGFQVEKRKSWGDEWEPIGFVVAKGNSSTYEFTDDSPLSINYYRLRQMDNDGQNTLSKVVSASINSTKNLKIYPSIVFDNILNIENDKIENMPYSIFNMLGQPVKAGNITAQIDISNLCKGAFMLKIGNQQAKFVKE